MFAVEKGNVVESGTKRASDTLLPTFSFTEVNPGLGFCLPALVRLGLSVLLHIVVLFVLCAPMVFPTSRRRPKLKSSQPFITAPGAKMTRLSGQVLIAAPDTKMIRHKDNPALQACAMCLHRKPSEPPLITHKEHSTGNVGVEFPNEDTNQYLPRILSLYANVDAGSRVGFGDDIRAKYLFAPPPSLDQVPTPDGGELIDNFFWLTIHEPEKYQFINEIWELHPATRGLQVYALFPFPFQDRLETLIHMHPGNNCPPTQIAVGDFEFDPTSETGVKVLRVTCTRATPSKEINYNSSLK